MDEIRQQKIEALQFGCEYIEKLIPAMKEIIPELRGLMLPDTRDFLNQQIEGLNFVIEIMNATMDLINEKETVLIKENIEEKIQLLSGALNSFDNPKTADVLEGEILPMLDIFRQVSMVIVQNEAN